MEKLIAPGKMSIWDPYLCTNYWWTSVLSSLNNYFRIKYTTKQKPTLFYPLDCKLRNPLCDTHVWVMGRISVFLNNIFRFDWPSFQWCAVNPRRTHPSKKVNILLILAQTTFSLHSVHYSCFRAQLSLVSSGLECVDNPVSLCF